MSIPSHISLVTLGVEDLARSVRFYEALGWQRSSASQEAIAFFRLGNVALGLFGRVALAEDAALPAEPRAPFGGVTLAINLGSPAAVDAALAAAQAAGATLLKAAAQVFWGGYSGYFADPDGHPWEVAHNPLIPLREDGSLDLP